MHRKSKLFSAVPWLILFVVLLVAGALGMAWALPGRAALGQTIPLPPTATPTPAVIAPVQPTATWTPRPTWTRAPTLPSTQPSPTLQEPIASPTSIRTEAATIVPTLSVPVVSIPTASPMMPEPTPTATMTLPPIPLVFEIAVQPQIAGPADEVHFLLQVANVGHESIAGVVISLACPEDLKVQSVDCERCTMSQEGARWRFSIGQLLPGEQVIAPILTRVAEDAWPGQLLRTNWTLTAVDMPTRHIEVFVELPWAELPATGSVVSGVVVNEWKNESTNGVVGLQPVFATGAGLWSSSSRRTRAGMLQSVPQIR